MLDLYFPQWSFFFFFLIIWTCHFDTCWWRTWILNGPKSTLGKARSDLCMVVCLSPNFWVCFRSYMKCACINHCQYIYSHGFSLYFYDEQIDQKRIFVLCGGFISSNWWFTLYDCISSPLIGGLVCCVGVAFHFFFFLCLGSDSLQQQGYCKVNLKGCNWKPLLTVELEVRFYMFLLTKTKKDDTWLNAFKFIVVFHKKKKKEKNTVTSGWPLETVLAWISKQATKAC